MAPPCYTDLGKQARDLFTKQYHFGLIKLDLKTKTPRGVEFNVNGTSNNDTGKVFAHLETKHTVDDCGLTIKEKWTTDNNLITELSLEGQKLKGAKIGVVGAFTPQSGKKTGTLKSSYKHENFHANADVDLDHAGAILHSALVLGYQGWLTGGQFSFDPSKSKLTRTNFSIGYMISDFALHTSLNDGQEFAGSIFQRVNSNLETGIQLAWSSANNSTRLGIGAVYKFDGATSMRAKINNASQIGLGFTHRLRDGINLTLCAMIDGKNFNQGGHKVGLGFDLEA